MMGKKRPQKTKELSVAIAEASSKGDEEETEQQQQQQPELSTPRKRGRPRKVINERIEAEEKRVAEQAEAGSVERQVTIDEDVKKSSSCEKDEKASMDVRGLRRSSRRKKSKPIKSI